MISWDEEKERWLLMTRGISFHEIAMRKKSELDHFEKGIEAHSSGHVPIHGEKREHIETLLARARKAKNINIRISEYDLANLKRKAAQEGIPYQTLISAFCTGLWQTGSWTKKTYAGRCG